jgi:two-component system NtrC family sensor kinase
MPAAKAFLDIQAVVRSAVQLRTLDLRDENIHIQFECETVLPGVRGDPNQLLQVFYNLVNNAVDAMRGPAASGRPGVLTVRALRERGHVVIEFSDNGPGMRDPDRVFDPFYTTKSDGTGLGLSICYGIIKEHEGTILAFNRAEGGATFRIELPAVQAALPTTTVAATAPATESLGKNIPALRPASPVPPVPALAATGVQETPANSDALVLAKPNIASV